MTGERITIANENPRHILSEREVKKRHKIHVGDTLTPLYFQLKYLADDGTYTPVNLTGKSVYFVLENEDGSGVVTGTGTYNDCVVTDAANGKGYYDFQDTDVDAEGTYYGYFVVYSGNERDTYPNEAEKLEIVIQ